MKKRTMLACLILCLSQTACGYRAKSIAASITPVSTYASQYKHALSLGDISGGSLSIPLLGTEGISQEDFRSALEKTLQANGMLSEPAAEAAYKIDADVKPEQPSFATSDDNLIQEHVHYKIIDLKNNAPVFDQTITTSAPGPFFSWQGLLLTPAIDISKQKRNAFDKAISDNISQFINSLKQ